MSQNAPGSRHSAQRRYDTAERRWAGIGPYYAMFPTAFADAVVRQYTQPGQHVLDPFAGRGTAVFSAAAQWRSAVGVEINPLGYVYANAKLHPAPYPSVMAKLAELSAFASRERAAADALPSFFHACFAPRVRAFLLAARTHLNWRRNRTDRTLMAHILISLHGKARKALSNQMRQSTAMAPDYCLRWWAAQHCTPPDIDPVAFLERRFAWRYARGVPHLAKGHVFLHDSPRKLRGLTRDVHAGRLPKVNLLLTSPPYLGVTNYAADQWLRLWLLGGPPRQTGTLYGGRFRHAADYGRLLTRVFGRARPMLADDATLYVRTDTRPATLQHTRTALLQTFPDKRLTETACPLPPQRHPKPYSRGGAPKRPTREVDFILQPR